MLFQTSDQQDYPQRILLNSFCRRKKWRLYRAMLLVSGEGFIRCSYAASVRDLTEAFKRMNSFVRRKRHKSKARAFSTGKSQTKKEDTRQTM